MKRFGKIENEEDKSIFEPTGKTIARRGSWILFVTLVAMNRIAQEGIRPCLEPEHLRCLLLAAVFTFSRNSSASNFPHKQYFVCYANQQALAVNPYSQLFNCHIRELVTRFTPYVGHFLPSGYLPPDLTLSTTDPKTNSAVR